MSETIHKFSAGLDVNLPRTSNVSSSVDTLSECAGQRLMMREQKLVLTSCDAIRHGPLVAYEDEQHRQGPGVLWRMGNLGANAASDLAITMIVNSMSRVLKYSVGHSHDDDLDSVVLVGVVCVSNASSLGRLSLVKSSFDHDLPAT